MGRGVSKSSGLGGGGGGNINVLSTEDMISNRGQNVEATDQVLNVARDLYNEYGDNGVLVGNMQIATLAPGSRAMAYYDSEGNVAMNKNYFDTQVMNAAYDACVGTGFHPGRGNKSGIEAVAAHEFGHSISDVVGKKSGKDIDQASYDIVRKAMKQTKSRNVEKFATNISRYAKKNYAECVAEAIADCYCNGKNAKKESKAIQKVIKNELGLK